MSVRSSLRSGVVSLIFLAGLACGAWLAPPAPARAQEDDGGTRVAGPALEWQRLNSKGGAGRLFVFRAKVPGGWLVLARTAPFPNNRGRRQGQGQGRIRPGPGEGGGDEQQQEQPGPEQEQEQERPSRRNQADVGVSLTFLPDPSHAWDGGSSQ